MPEKTFTDKTIDSLFSASKYKYILLGILALGFILRLIAALNLGVNADDMFHATKAINFLENGRLETYDQSAGLWYAFTDLMYFLFGYTQLASRIAALLFGTASILLVYALSRHFFEEKTSLCAALLIALSPYQIKNTIAEMDAMAMFFVLFSSVLFLTALSRKKNSLYLVSGVFLGLAVYTKVYPLLFVPAFILYFYLAQRKQKNPIVTKKTLKQILAFVIPILLLSVPALTHNYLLYKDKGIMDLQFTRTFGFGVEKSEPLYAWDPIWDEKNAWSALFFGGATQHDPEGDPLLLKSLGYFFWGSPLNFILVIAGIVLALRKKHPYLKFSFIHIVVPWFFLASIILLPKHYLFLELFLIPLGAYTLTTFIAHPKLKNYPSSTRIVALVVFLFTLYYLGTVHTMPGYYGKSSIASLIDYKEEIPANSIIVGDSRIYTNRLYWAAYGVPFIGGGEFVSILNQQASQNVSKVSVKVYFVECVLDDCGWGKDKITSDLNGSMESLVEFFSEKGALEKTISEPIHETSFYPLGGERRAVYKVHSINLALVPQAIAYARSPKQSILYTVGYLPKENQFDYYKTHSFFDDLLNKTALLLARLALLLAIVSPFYSVYLWVRGRFNLSRDI